MLKVVGFIGQNYIIALGKGKWKVYDRKSMEEFPEEKIDQKECNKLMNGELEACQSL